MSDIGARAGRAGQEAEAQGHWAQRNARFIDPWKQAAKGLASYRLNQSRYTPAELQRIAKHPLAQRRGLKPINPVTSSVLTGVEWIARLGAERREAARWGTPSEYTPMGIEEQLQAQRMQQQPGDRGPQQSAEGNLSQEQFAEQHRAQFGPELTPGGSASPSIPTPLGRPPA